MEVIVASSGLSVHVPALASDRFDLLCFFFVFFGSVVLWWLFAC
jgi:hypothetical protein